MGILKNLKVPFFTGLFIFLFLFLYAKFGPPLSFTINDLQTVKPVGFQSQGTGSITVIPDVAFITFDVSATQDTLAATQGEVKKNVDEAIAGLRKRGIAEKDIKTISYTIEPSGDIKNASYFVTEQVSISVRDLQHLHTFLTLLSGYNVNLENGVTFGFSDQFKQKIQNQLRDQAITQAKENAQSLAQKTGIHLGRIIDIQENPPTFPDPSNNIPMQLTQDTNSANQATTANPEQNTVTTNVTLSYQTY